MARPKKTMKAEDDPRQLTLPLDGEPSEIMDKAVSSAPKPQDLESWPLESLRDYLNYNKEARRLNKLYRINRYPIKPCPVELHPTERVVFGRNDQPNNPLPVFLSNDLIEFKMKLWPGKTYDLPVCVVDYLSKKGSPIWKWRTNTDGSKETYVDHYSPRFAMRTVYAR